MNEDPLISVIIPTYNCAETIELALDAVMSQTYSNIEIIVVDDKSTDKTAEVVQAYKQNQKRFPITYVTVQKVDSMRVRNGTNINAGWLARNEGVAYANGEYITFQDADDGSYADRIQFQYDMAKKFDVVHVNVDYTDFDAALNGKQLGYTLREEDIVHTKEILKLTKKTKRSVFTNPYTKNEKKNFLSRVVHFLDRKYIRDWTPYPCAASMPLVHKSVFEICKFRQLYDRVWPSERGRGADRDFNFWVAETFKKSIAIQAPFILWRR